MATDSTSETMTLAEAADLLGVSVAFAQQLVDRDVLGPVIRRVASLRPKCWRTSSVARNG